MFYVVPIAHIPGIGSYAVRNPAGVIVFRGTLTECDAYAEEQNNA